MAMAFEREDFSLSGPSYLTCIDWSNDQHRTSVAASLVKGVYIMELDRQEKREGSEALAPPWWDFFQFKLLEPLVDDADLSIFGAIFEKNDSIIDQQHSPRYIIAFRGTIIKEKSVVRDFELDTDLILNQLHQTSRFKIAMEAVRKMVDSGLSCNSNVWLAGHSLGSGMAMLAGKSMAKSDGRFLETFLFNPPFVSAPMERIKSKRVKFGLRIAASVIKAGLAIANNQNQNQNNQRNLSESEDPFATISAWVPRLYVNRSDRICSGYLGYFKHRKNMEDIGIGHIEKLATQHSLGGLLMYKVGISAEVSEPFHLIPSANLTENRPPPTMGFKKAHSIHQWWSSDLKLRSKLYRYP